MCLIKCYCYVQEEKIGWGGGGVQTVANARRRVEGNDSVYP